MKKKLAIVGGGAAGLSAAIEARRENKDIKITVFERLQKCGKKILATGNGRCNFTNTEATRAYLHGDTRFLSTVLSSPFADSVGFFRSLGMLSYEEDGRLYPLSQQASTVRDILLNFINENNIEIKTEVHIKEIKEEKNGFILNDEFFDAVIICGGGKASPVHGSDGSAYKLLTDFGHSCSPLYPALCALTFKDTDLNLLKGVRADCFADLYSEKLHLGCERGEVQFTEKAVSGIPVMNLSYLCEDNKDLTLILDLCPDFKKRALTEHINETILKFPETEFELILNGLINIKLGYAVMNRCKIKPHTKCKELSNKATENVVKAIKCFKLNISGTKGFSNAQVTCGGINTFEFYPETLMSKMQDGIFACGEILNVDGKCGGFNLHFAWTTGRIAGSSAANYLK